MLFAEMNSWPRIRRPFEMRRPDREALGLANHLRSR